MTSLADRAATIRIRGAIRKAGHDPRVDAEFAAALNAETDRSLRDPRRWPYTGPQRWRGPSTADLKVEKATR